MKLIHEVARLCTVGIRGVSVPVGGGPREFHVTVPASLPRIEPVTAAGTAGAPGTLSRAEPPSFLKAPRHLRPVSNR